MRKIFKILLIAVLAMQMSIATGFAEETVYSTVGQDELLELLTGWTAYEVDSDGYIDVETFSQEQKTYFGTGFYKQFTDREMTTLSFKTASPSFKFEYKTELADGYVDIYIDGVRRNCTAVSTLEESGEISYNLDGEMHNVDIYLPRGGLLIRNLAVEEGYAAEKIERTKVLFYGDSITYGYLLEHSSDTYVNVLARKMDYEVVNFGVGGYYFDGGQVMTNNFEPDIIFVAYGANDTHNYGANVASQITTKATAFMDNVRQLYPTQKIYVITPTWANDTANRIAYLPTAREAITAVCENYDNVTVIDGLEMIPGSSSNFIDGVHPNAGGHAIYAENLEKELKGVKTPVNEKSWQVKYYGTANTDRERYSASVTSDYKFAGENAMFIKYPGTMQDGNYVEIKTATTEKLMYGDYTLTFYNKGSRSNLTEICIGENIVIGYSDMEREGVPVSEVPSGESSWSKLTYTFNYPDQSETDYIIFRYYGGTQQTVIDEISLVAADGFDNFIPDPGFDGVEVPDYSDEPYDTTLYQAKNLHAAAGSGKLGLSWVNPETTDLTGVSIYDVNGGDWQLLNGALPAEPGRIVYYVAEGLTNGNNYTYAVRFKFGSRPEFTYYITGSPSASSDYTFGSWNIQTFKTGAAGYCPGEVTLETDDLGNSYARIRSNIDPALDDKLNGNIYIRLWQNVTLEPNTKYQLTMRAKSEDVTKVNMLMNWSGFNENGGWSVPSFVGTSDWADYTFTYDAGDTAPSYYHIIMENPGTLYIDDICIKKLENGEAVGENAITDGGFEEMFSDDVGSFTGVQISDVGMNELTLSWNGSTSRIAKVNIYRKLFDNYEYRGTLGMGNTTLKMENLSIGTEYTYLLVPVNSLGYEGEGIEVTATTEMPDYEITEAKLYKANSQVYAPSGEGTYTVQTTVKNYKIESMPYTQAVAVYKNNTLEKLYVTQQVFEIQDKGRPAIKVNTTFPIGEGNGYSIEVFALDSMETLNAYIPCKIFE